MRCRRLVQQRLSLEPGPESLMKSTDVELVIGGLAALVLVGFGIYLIAEANDSSENTSSELEDTSALATLATVVP